MRVDRATLTAWLRPIERAPPGAPLCLSTITIRSTARGPGPPESCESGTTLGCCPKNGT